MTNYTKTTDFAAKDSLLTGNPSKVIRGVDINNEFLAIETAVASKTDVAGLTASSGSSLVGFIQSGTDAVATTVQTKLRESVSVLDFGPNTTPGTTDMTSAITAAVAAINANGGGVLIFPPGNYAIWPTLPGAALAAFTSCNNLTIVSHGAKITIPYAWAGTEKQDVFQFTDCKNLTLDLPELVSTVQAVAVRDSRGPALVRFLGNCENITIPKIKATGAQSVVVATAAYTATEAQRTRGIFIGVGYADRCGYGMNFQFSGDEVFVGQWHSIAPVRSYFPYGVRGHVVNINSQDQYADDCLMRSYSGKGLENIKINYTNVKTTASYSSSPCVSLAPGDQTPAVFKDISVKIRAHWPAAGYFGYGFHLFKNDNGGGYDAVDRGHIFDGLNISANFTSNYASSIGLRICQDGTWSTGEYMRNFVVRDYVQIDGGSSTIGCQSMQDPPTFENVDSAGAFYVQSAPYTAAAILRGCKATNLTSATNDAGYCNYYDCEVTSGALQSDVNKTFLNFNYAGRFISDYAMPRGAQITGGKSLSGDLTGTNNIFYVKTPGGNGGYFRLTYALVADQGDSNPATRDETYGVKSFSATIDSSGVWTAQTAVAQEVTERTLGTASVVTVSLVNGTSAGAYIAVACTNYNGASARGSFYLEFTPMNAALRLSLSVTPA